jgi:hypothetical protein
VYGPLILRFSSCHNTWFPSTTCCVSFLQIRLILSANSKSSNFNSFQSCSAERVVGDNKFHVEYKFITGTRSKGRAHWMSGVRNGISISREGGRSSGWAIIHQQSL